MHSLPFLLQCPQAGFLSLPAEEAACMSDCFYPVLSSLSKTWGHIHAWNQPLKIQTCWGDLLPCASCGEEHCATQRQLLLNDFMSPSGDGEGAKRWHKETKVNGLPFKWLLNTIYNEKPTLALMHSCLKALKVCSCMADFGGSTAAAPPFLHHLLVAAAEPAPEIQRLAPGMEKDPMAGA